MVMEPQQEQAVLVASVLGQRDLTHKVWCLVSAAASFLSSGSGVSISSGIAPSSSPSSWGILR
uniref:Uncharacterized protein n=1 Tax=Picea glauca TaxID=3330 RepID=A0A101M0S7_PICGL|nr:hypothetical protein ABT39_MTgene4252 [Picea glauca]